MPNNYPPLNERYSDDDIPSVMFGIGRTPKLPDGHVLYYAGSGSDYGPLVHFATNFEGEMPLGAVFYVDYLTKVAEINDMLHKLPHLNDGYRFRMEKLTPDYLHQRTWTKFWPDNGKGRDFAKPKSAYAFASEIHFQERPPLWFHFYRTEAIQTYENLLKAQVFPTIVVLQDHGWGGNWTQFGGENEMYHLAVDYNALPEFLFVADNTRAWPGYKQYSDYLVLKGQMHNHERAIYRRDRSISGEDLWRKRELRIY